MGDLDYWRESIWLGAEACELVLTSEQVDCLAESVQGSHENYGMAFYSPPASDRIGEIEREWKAKYDALRAEFESYQRNAETAVKRALRQGDDAVVSIGKYGEVTRYDGGTTILQ